MYNCNELIMLFKSKQDTMFNKSRTGGFVTISIRIYRINNVGRLLVDPLAILLYT